MLTKVIVHTACAFHQGFHTLHRQLHMSHTHWLSIEAGLDFMDELLQHVLQTLKPGTIARDPYAPGANDLHPRVLTMLQDVAG